MQKHKFFIINSHQSPSFGALELMYTEHRVTFYYFQDVLAKSYKFWVMAEDINP